MENAQVTLLSVKVEDPNHVGQAGDWTYEVEINNAFIETGEAYTFQISDDRLLFNLKVCENDMITDIGKISKYLQYSQIRNKEITLTVPIRENRGRFAGNTAKAFFLFEIK